MYALSGQPEGVFHFDRERTGMTLESTPFSPPSGPATGSFNGLHRESNFLAIKQIAEAGC